ncbi:hypothetical protein L195_g056130 [Trifolium pratense]|uniref:Uncharacterized protein n=1 Tax=Trifolium pratense TaxID=57577 RepID=A0A2K3KPY6_TRIPR|nr:hypothetical protein L195_g056130 [Trifolium pratense]
MWVRLTQRYVECELSGPVCNVELTSMGQSQTGCFECAETRTMQRYDGVHRYFGAFGIMKRQDLE